MKFEKIIEISPPFDKRNKDPKKNYGVGSMRIWFVLKKGQKAVQVLISTNLFLLSVRNEFQERISIIDEGDYEGFSCWDVGYHSNTSQYKGQTKMSCQHLKSGECYYDGSSLRGKDDKVAENFIKHGIDWIWSYLEEEWNRMFGEIK